MKWNWLSSLKQPRSRRIEQNRTRRVTPRRPGFLPFLDVLERREMPATLTSVLPHLKRDKIARFPTMVTSNQGLVVVYMERIS